MKPAGRILLAAILLFSCAGSGAQAAKTETVQEINKLLEDEKNQLEKLKEKIDRREQQLSAIGKKETSLLKTLERLGDRLKLRERELRIYQWNIQINKKQMGTLEQKITEMEGQIKRQQHVLGSRLRALYKEGGLVPVRILFSANGLGEALQRLKYLDSVMAYDTAVFRSYESKLQQLKTEKQTLTNVKTNLLTLEKAALSKKEELEKEKSGKSAFLKKVSGEKHYALQARKELMQSSEDLNSLIARLQEKLVLGKGLSIVDKKGRLRLPVPGVLVNKFGRHKDKKYGTYIVNNGVDLKIPAGTPVDGLTRFAHQRRGA